MRSPRNGSPLLTYLEHKERENSGCERGRVLKHFVSRIFFPSFFRDYSRPYAGNEGVRLNSTGMRQRVSLEEEGEGSALTAPGIGIPGLPLKTSFVTGCEFS